MADVIPYASPQPASATRTFLGHPPGLFLLFLVEMWERFSYYGMRALLVLYLRSPASGMLNPPAGHPTGFNPGRGWDKEASQTLLGWYAGFAYLMPIFGGIIADKLIGTHRSMVIGGLIIALGHIALAVSGMGPLGHTQMGMSIFIFGLALIVMGTGHFKPTVSVMVGQLYAPNDPRRDSAFSIFYMGVNLGAFLTPFACGWLGERVGWHWGFGTAAVGMLAGLLFYTIGRPHYLAGIGLPPAGAKNSAPVFICGSLILAGLFALLFYFEVISRLQGFMQSKLLGGAVAALVLGLALWFIAVQDRADRGPVAAIFIFIFLNIFFWTGFEQAASSLNLFTDDYTNRQVGSWLIPTTWFQSVNALMIFVLAPVFAAMWVSLGRRGLNPSQPAKIGLGLIFLGLGYIFMTLAAISVKAGVPGATAAKASMFFIIATYFIHTLGELCISPTGLSFVTRVAPVRFVSLLMGAWFVSNFVANLAAGLIAAKIDKISSGQIKLPWHLGGQADFFMSFVVVSIGIGILVLIFVPLLKRLYHGRA